MSRYAKAPPRGVPPRAPMPPGSDWPAESTIGDETSTSGESDSSNDHHPKKAPRRRRNEDSQGRTGASQRRRESGAGFGVGIERRKEREEGYYSPRTGLNELMEEQEKARRKKETERVREQNGSAREESIPGTYYIYDATTKEYFPFPQHLDYDPSTSQIFKRRTKHRGPEETARKEEDSSSRSRNAERRPDSAASSAKSYYTYDGGSATSMEGKSRNGVPLRGWNRRKSTAYDEHDVRQPVRYPAGSSRATREAGRPPAAYETREHSYESGRRRNSFYS